MRYRDTWHHAPETAGTALAAMDGESTMLEWDDAPGYSPDPPEHIDEYGLPDYPPCPTCGRNPGVEGPPHGQHCHERP